MLAKTLLAAALLSTCLLAHAAPAASATRQGDGGEPPLALSLVRGGQIATDPVVNGTLAYVGTGRVIATWDFRNPSSPLRLSTSAPADGVISGLVRHGDYLYASWTAVNEDSGIVVFSLANPAQPELVWAGGYPTGEYTRAGGLVVANDHLYLFDSEIGVFVASLANPEQPQFTLVPDAGLPGPYSRVTAYGNLVYGVGRTFMGDTVFDTYDVGNPTAPVMLSSVMLDGINNYGVAPDARRAVSVGWQFNTWDLSVPGDPVQRSSTEIYGAISATIAGNRAYTYGFMGLEAWDIGDLAAPRLLGSHRTPTLGARTSAVMGRTLLVPTATDLMQAYNVRPAIPALLSSSWIPGGVDARAVAMHDGRLVLLQGAYGLTINDAQTLAPVARFEARLPQTLQSRAFEGLAVAGDVAYLAAWGHGLITVDLASPTPREIGRMPFPYASVVEVAGDYAYLAKNTEGPLFGVADISDPRAPALVWQAPLPGMPRKLKVADGHVYLAESSEGGTSGGLHVFDIANPAAPRAVAHLNERCGSAYDLAIDEANARLYLACDRGMQVVDIATPAAPRVIGGYRTGESGIPTRVAIRGDRAWYTDASGLHEVDVGDPAQPVLVQMLGIGRNLTHHVLPLDDGRLVAAGAGGVHLFAPRTPTDARKPRIAPSASRAATR